MLYLSNAVPFPNQKDKQYIAAVADEVEHLITASHGHAAVLFTSYNAMGQVYALLSERDIPFPMFRIYALMPWYTAQEIAQKCGMYSLTGKPHAQAASCIINENLFIGAEHKRAEASIYGGYSGVSVRYDSYALCETMKWLVDNGLPTEIYGIDRAYHTQYVG